MLTQFVEKHPNDVRIVYRHFPLPTEGPALALLAAQGSEAAGLQGKFWEMHNLIFAQQATWRQMSEAQLRTWMTDQAQQLGMNRDQFTRDLSSQAVVNKVKQAQDHGLRIGIPGTPLVLLNGQYYQGPRDLESLESILQLFKLRDQQFTFCPPMVIDPQKQYTATIKTEKGDVVVELFPDKAPLAVNSFVFLAREGWFNNITFHRVIPGFMAQTGDPSGTGFGGPGYSFDDEITDLRFDKEGLLGMANAGPGSNGSQFFITYGPTPDLDGKYTIFGQVTQGMEVVKSFTPRDPSQAVGLPAGDRVQSVEIQEK